MRIPQAAGRSRQARRQPFSMLPQAAAQAGASPALGATLLWGAAGLAHASARAPSVDAAQEEGHGGGGGAAPSSIQGGGFFPDLGGQATLLAQYHRAVGAPQAGGGARQVGGSGGAVRCARRTTLSSAHAAHDSCLTVRAFVPA